MSWLDADDDDEEDDDDYQFLEEVSENWRRGTTIPPRSVFKIDGLVPALSPLQLGLGSELSPKAGLQSPTRYKAKPLRDNDKSTQEREDMYEVEQLREATDEENEVSKLFVFCDEGCEDNLLHDAREKMSHQDSRSFATIHTCSKEKQECTRRSLKHKSIHTKLFEKLSKGQFPFDWSKKNGGAHGGNKVPSSELKRNDKNVRIPTVAQANGIQGCKTKNVHQLHKELTDAAPETHTFSCFPCTEDVSCVPLHPIDGQTSSTLRRQIISSKTHNGLCSSLSIPSNQKIHSYHNPLQGASASFIHRLTEIASLECDTIRQEKIRKLKKRSDC